VDVPDDSDSTASSRLDPLSADVAQLVRGTAALGVCGHETTTSVVVDALRAFFREYDTAREAAAVQQYLAGAIPRHRVGELVGRCGERLDATIAEYRPAVESEESENLDPDDTADAAESNRPGDTEIVDLAGDTADAERLLAAVAAEDPGLRTLVRGAARVGIDGLDEEGDVLRAALRHYFRRHESLRHAATARQYALGRMTTDFASDMADVQKGPEIEELLWAHGVRPRVGPEPSEQAEREEQLIRSKLFDGIERPDADDAN
jgi:hypothetical protein